MVIKIKFIFLLLVFASTFNASWAQQGPFKISGHVMSNEGDVLPGVNILLNDKTAYILSSPAIRQLYNCEGEFVCQNVGSENSECSYLIDNLPGQKVIWVLNYSE